MASQESHEKFSSTALQAVTKNLWPLLAEISGISRCPQAEELELGGELALCSPLGNLSHLCSSGDCKEPLLRRSSSWWPTWVGAGKRGEPRSRGRVELSLSPEMPDEGRGGTARDVWVIATSEREKVSRREGGWHVYSLGSEACWDQSQLWCTAEGAPFIGEPSGDNAASSMETVFIICPYSGIFIPKVKKE